MTLFHPAMWRGSLRPQILFVDFAIKDVNDMKATGDGPARTTKSNRSEIDGSLLSNWTAPRAVDLQDQRISPDALVNFG